MKKTTNLLEVQHALAQEETVILYLSMPNCSVCHAVLPRFEHLLSHYDFPSFHLDVAKTPEVASVFQILTAPAILIYHKNKEVARQARFIDFQSLENLLNQLSSIDETLSYDKLFD
ncbi:thioredoxin family protein [Enterococcus villorum]|uniref:Thiol reductase thioredoxin n=2 Tax=Enterococcus villorum TaxID=112904 RepID=A0A511J5D3_9ENTE|nr:thioredoxin family protein [Enterococcus villorum]EOH85888.1 thioredoxin [Enterococcus villorum ATCC 700913]EOW78533.1 thioredoxin [Enterococcus villorum ATCC 700913]GEL93210.1 thiol reductase thioredoxin [Enterococcus villorum]